MSQVLCSTGALIGRPNNRDYRLLKDFSKELICDGYEFMMYSTWYGVEQEIADFIKNNNIHVPVMHCAKGVGELILKRAHSRQWQTRNRVIYPCPG